MDTHLHLFLAISCFCFGAIVGSFLNVVIVRLPHDESLVYPPSRCPHCGHPIRGYDNIPLVSYLFLWGKCRDCGSRISVRYPLIEAVTAMLATALYLKDGITPASCVFFLFCAAMVVVFWIDYYHMIIPDVISLNGLAVGVIASTVQWIPGMTWSTSLLGALAGGLILYVPAVIYEKVRGVEGLGRGDIKLLAMIGAFIGPVGVVFVLFFSSLTGCLAALVTLFRGAHSTTPIPFGPFLTCSAVFFVFVGADVIDYAAELSFRYWAWFMALSAHL
jgi:leader peptidase (prepilin peptidase) / N-methyltransferase